MTPTIDGVVHHFAVAGLYDGVVVLRDRESGTLWNHVTGEAIYGPLAGRRLEVSNLLQMNVAQALEMDPNVRIAISPQRYAARVILWTDANLSVSLNETFEATLGAEDTRRERMEMGLGIWSDDARRFYPMESIRRKGNALIDTFEGRHLLVYIDPSTATPAAVFVEARKAERKGKDIVLSNGSTVRSGVFYDPTGAERPPDRPLQVFTRWYGFSLSFPDPDVYNP